MRPKPSSHIGPPSTRFGSSKWIMKRGAPKAMAGAASCERGPENYCSGRRSTFVTSMPEHSGSCSKRSRMADPLANVCLALFLTRGMSLRAWDDIGLLDREAAPYRRLEPMLRRVMFVTYGDRQDLTYAPRLGGIRVHCNRWRVSPQLYERYLTKAMPWSWRGPVVVKSNQVQGSE